jgi:hypothetical protein
MNLIQLIIEALESSATPLTVDQILGIIEQNPKRLRCEELTRVRVARSAIARQLTKYSGGWTPVVERVHPKRYRLRDKTIPVKANLKEADLHPYLVKFAFDRFNVSCKTINALKIAKKRNAKISIWSNPDIVGINPVILNLNDLFQCEVEKLGILSTKVLEFYSFELKLKIDKSNLTECYFQAVSNSSWANFGYLVVADLDRDKNFISNLIRLNSGYGIGVIHLNTETPQKSEIIVSARQREVADINFMNFLSGINKDYYNFIEQSRQIVVAKTVDDVFFDRIVSY